MEPPSYKYVMLVLILTGDLVVGEYFVGWWILWVLVTKTPKSFGLYTESLEG